MAWRRLHRLVYLIGILGVLHYLWLAKVGVHTPYYYAAWLALVLGVRVVDAVRRAGSGRGEGAGRETALAPGPARPA